MKNLDIMTTNIFDNYSAFYNMVLSTTMLSNAQTPELEQDAKKIIELICGAYHLDSNMTEQYCTIILDHLAKLGRTTDQQAVYSRRSFDDQYSMEDVLFDIKGDVLTKLQKIGEDENYFINQSWFDYRHYKTYEAKVRYHKISITSSTGNIDATRQVGIQKALGIGCQQDYDIAIMRLMQCAFWGDISAMHLLAYVYQLNGNQEKSALYCELAEISTQYLNTGCTLLPEKAKKNYSETARTYYVYISTIKQDIIHANKMSNIDFSFIEAITAEHLDYYQRMQYINNYCKMEWKDVTNSAEKPNKKIGFK